MTHDEKGYVQFDCAWEPAPPPADPVVATLAGWRNRLHRLGLVGVYPDGIGYGNLSARLPGGSFAVTGTATGAIELIGPEHCTEVTDFDIAANRLRCRGPVRASSESLTHAAVYRADPSAAAVVHVHHPGLWGRLRGVAPTTDPHAEAGTPAMAWAIEQLLRDPAVRGGGLVVMGGHRDGLLGFSPSVDAAGERLLAALADAGTAR